jgi:hypothetical protein
MGGTESARVEWVPLADLNSMISKGEITSGISLLALLSVLDAMYLPALPTGLLCE